MTRVDAAPRAAVPAPGAPSRVAAPKSNARAEASRRNGAKSRGPKTPEGKARSAQNALRHGLRAEKYVVLPEEDGAEFAALEAALRAELAPQGALQVVLARRVAVAAWRLMRADRMEVEVFAERSWGADPNTGLALIRDGNGTRSFETLLRYRGAAMAEFMRALRTLKTLQAERRAHAAAEVAAPVRLRAVASARAAVAVDPSAAASTEPNEPEGRRKPGRPGQPRDRATAGGAPPSNDLARILPRAPAAGAADAGPPAPRMPIEPETGQRCVAAAPDRALAPLGRHQAPAG